MRNDVHLSQGVAKSFAVGYVAPDEFNPRGKLRGLARWVNLGIQDVQNANLKPVFVKAINQMASNESGTASDKNSHD